MYVLLYILHTSANTYYQPSQVYRLCSLLRYLVVTLWCYMLVNRYTFVSKRDRFIYVLHLHWLQIWFRWSNVTLLQKLSRSKVMSHSAPLHRGPNSLSSSMESIGCNWQKQCGSSSRSALPNHLEQFFCGIICLPRVSGQSSTSFFSHFL